jgi:hypothetical protein
VADVLDQIHERLEKASRLVDAAESLTAQSQLEADAAESMTALSRLENAADLFEEADEHLKADAIWAEFGHLVDEAERHGKAADIAFADAGEETMTPTAALDMAEERARGIRADLRRESPRARHVKDLKARADALRDRIVALRQLSA